jgi:3-isopropylmalate/(R)-2-methylmalate dehydratase large subunit
MGDLFKGKYFYVQSRLLEENQLGKTIAEKIIGDHTGRDVSAGENAIVRVDYTFTHDASGPLVIRKLKELGRSTVFNPEKTIMFMDHCVPSHQRDISNDQAFVRSFAKDVGIIFRELGSGICHQLIAEDYASPGDLIVGSDSHTVTAGALGAFATGMGATDIAVVMALGKTWMRVPETHRIIVDGKMPKGVYGKDIILNLIGKLGADGANYKSLEFQGETIRNLMMYERLTISNMVVEAGAKVGLMSSDDQTRRYLEQRNRMENFREIHADEDANYERSIIIKVDDMEPQVALPHAVDNVKPVTKIGEIKVSEVFIGSCTNARLEDLQIAASILNGQRIHNDVRLIITPASQDVLVEALKDGTLKILLEAGAVMTTPGCGVCFGALGGIPADGEVCFSTSNRNFQGRQGNPKAFTYLGSPAMAAATAITGIITDPREVL